LLTVLVPLLLLVILRQQSPTRNAGNHNHSP
jgi:hypothetical protein